MSLKNYEALVKKIKDTKPGDERNDLVRQKGEVSRALFADTKNRKATKAAVDAINNS